MEGATVMIAPPAAACFSRWRREKSRTARCVFSLDVGFAFLVTLVLPKTLTCLRGAHLRRPLPRAQVFLRGILSLDLNLAAAMKASQGQLGTADGRSEEHTSELQSLMRISYAVFCWKKTIHKYTQKKNR